MYRWLKREKSPEPMPTIEIVLDISAPIERVFDLSRSIDLHMISTKQSNEQAIAGKTSGLIEFGESVTWRAKHVGLYQHLTSKITEFNRPFSFTDEMVSGAFKSFKHQHVFKTTNKGTQMSDIFKYTTPCGALGRLADKLFLEKYMTRLLSRRVEVIKKYAESDLWEAMLKD